MLHTTPVPTQAMHWSMPRRSIPSSDGNACVCVLFSFRMSSILSFDGLIRAAIRFRDNAHSYRACGRKIPWRKKISPGE
jgi:hypothetical protein